MNTWRDTSTEARKARWKELWAMEDLPRPLWFIPATPVLGTAMMWMQQKKPLTPLFTDREIQFNESMNFNKTFSQLQQSNWKDDFVPHLQAQQGVGVFASAFGCKVDFPPDNLPWSHFIIRAGDAPRKVYELPEPDVRDGCLGDMLDFSRHFDRKAGGEYPIAMTDLQGPMDTAYLIWDSTEFMAAMYDAPECVHHLMRLVTDLIKRFAREMRSIVKEFVPAHWPPIYLPDGMGIAISEDCLAVLSPELYEEFSLPYVNELSEEFGGIVIHSCGDFTHQLPVLEKVHNLRGINFGISETRFEDVWERFGGRTVVIPHLSGETIVARFDSQLDFVEHVLACRTTNRGLAIMASPFEHPSEDRESEGGWGEALSFGDKVRELMERYKL